jgi:hypothetical protein
MKESKYKKFTVLLFLFYEFTLANYFKGEPCLLLLTPPKITIFVDKGIGPLLDLLDYICRQDSLSPTMS